MTMRGTNRCWRLARRPVEHEYAEALDLDEVSLPALDAGQVLVRNGYLSLDAGTRMWMTDRSDSYDPPAPLGSVLQGQTLGVVAESRHPDFYAGQLLRFRGEWADYTVLTPADGTYIDTVSWLLPDLRQHLAVMGPNGWTAYVGLVEVGRAKAGETVVVSAASGVTGALAGQIAKLQGCRVVGITGSADKARWITAELGFDAAIDRSATPDMAAALAAQCPEGIDVYFENVGGAMLDAALGTMAQYGRIAVCGLLADYTGQTARRGPERFDQVLMRRLTVQGFFSADWHWRGPEINRVLGPWHDAGQLRMEFDVADGLEQAPEGYRRLLSGEKVGKSLVQISALTPAEAVARAS
jgi:NADPH-dependent curcumin reductase CurA